MASGHPSLGYFGAVGHRRFCIRMDTKLRRPFYSHIRQGKPILLCNISAANSHLGHRDDLNDSISSGSQWNGGAIPQTAKRVPHRPRRRRARQVVLASPHGPSRHTHDCKARYRRLTLRPRLRGRPLGPGGSSPKSSVDGRTTRASASVRPVQSATRSGEIATY